jgi:hypothetical protein
MTVDHNSWRDQQLNGFKNLSSLNTILEQELVMLNFVKSYPDAIWRWMAPDTQFKKICQEHISINNVDYNGLILFGPALLQQTTYSLVATIRKLASGCDYAYVAINRYEIIQHNLNFDLPNDIADSLDNIMSYCTPQFKRLHTFDQVDGNHMVAAHPMDCYGLCIQ